MAPAVRIVDISYFVKSGQLFMKMCIYALHGSAAKSISTNINGAFAGHTVYSKRSENTTKKTTMNHHKVIISSYQSKVIFFASPTNAASPTHSYLY